MVVVIMFVIAVVIMFVIAVVTSLVMVVVTSLVIAVVASLVVVVVASLVVAVVLLMLRTVIVPIMPVAGVRMLMPEAEHRHRADADQHERELEPPVLVPLGHRNVVVTDQRAPHVVRDPVPLPGEFGIEHVHHRHVDEGEPDGQHDPAPPVDTRETGIAKEVHPVNQRPFTIL